MFAWRQLCLRGDPYVCVESLMSAWRHLCLCGDPYACVETLMFAWRSLCLCGDPLGGHTRGNIASGNSFRQQCFLVYDTPFPDVSLFRVSGHCFQQIDSRSIPWKQFPRRSKKSRPVTSGQHDEWIYVLPALPVCRKREREWLWGGVKWTEERALRGKTVCVSLQHEAERI